MKIVSKSLAETTEVAGDFLGNLKREKEAVIVGLQGDLGSGKTAFVQAIAKRLGVSETVSSPTFVIEKIYKLEKSQLFEHLVHIDAYRLKNAEELVHLGWGEIAKNSNNLVFIEWPENVAAVLPTGAKHVNFRFIDEEKREINYE